MVPCFPLLGLTPSGLFMGLSSTIIYTSELILCSTICQKFPLKYNPLPRLCTRPVSRICHAGAVANVEFKLCRSMLDDHTLSRKVETSSSEAKIVRIGAGSFKIFSSRPEKGTDGLSFFALEGKIEQRIRISARKRPLSPGLSKQQCPALTSSIESYV